MSGTRWNKRPVTSDFVLEPILGAGMEGPRLRWARIENVDRMRPFFTTLASSSDHWGFISSVGPLTAGRRNVSQALFPYRTVDRIHDARGKVGGSTTVRLKDGSVWDPFTERNEGLRDVSRTIHRCSLGSALALEETDHDLGLRIRQTWTTSERHGLVRAVTLTNLGDAPRDLAVLDGVLDLVPASIDPGMARTLSNLVDAYRQTELVEGLGVFGLGSIPVDRAEPSEALRAALAWCSAPGRRLLSDRQAGAFRRGEELTDEPIVRGVRSSFLVEQAITLPAGGAETWCFTFETDQSAGDVEALLEHLGETSDPMADVLEGVAASRHALAGLAASVDGVQRSARDAEDSRHLANTLYNSMRGGLFPSGHELSRDLFSAHLKGVAPLVFAKHKDDIAAWPETFDAGKAASHANGDPDLERHLLEYLPLAFSRRHGDPSRPWNAFSIDVRTEDGSLRHGYQGNWRDIFQNWEALGTSFPAYYHSFIARFLNSSTADGYNPYRVTSDGFDWEVHDPDDPWSFIGYWSDHQIVYLTRLLDRTEERFPGTLAGLLGRAFFVHADVPYRVRPYADMVKDPRATVDYDTQSAEDSAERVKVEGPEGKLAHDRMGQLERVTLEEKLLVPFLTKVAALIPGAGIWLNTQRPEWNDANNALVGAGASIVTTCALVRHADVILGIFQDADDLVLSRRTARYVARIQSALGTADLGQSTAEPEARRRTVDALGKAATEHRASVYGRRDASRDPIDASEVRELIAEARRWLQATIDANRRDDGLLHGYDLVAFDKTGITIRHLPLMLEGQAAALGAGVVRGRDAIQLLDAMRASDLWWPEQRSYLLYPDRQLPGLLAKGQLPEGAAARVPLLKELADAGERTVVRRASEGLRFAPDIRNRAALVAALDALEATPFAAAAARDRDALLALHEEVFDHAAFTGRSGTFFGFEGLGCIYWHMVSKLVLAVQETVWRAVDDGEPQDVIDALVERYRDVRAGLGTHKTAEEYGAFPTEPYSHTPGDGGARQPGMTGQVKEDLLSRWGELGLRVKEGRIVFDGTLVNPDDLVNEPGELLLADRPSVPIPKDGAAYTHCGVPVVIQAAAPGTGTTASVEWSNRDDMVFVGGHLDEATSSAVWGRSGLVRGIRVQLSIPSVPEA